MENNFPSDVINNAQRISLLQSFLDNLTEENYSSTLQSLIGDDFITDSDFHDAFLRNLFWSFHLRPKSLSPLFDILFWFSSLKEYEAKSSLISFLLPYFHRCHSNFEDHSKFIFDFVSSLIQIIDSEFDNENTNEKYLIPFFEKLFQAENDQLVKIKEEISFIINPNKPNYLISIFYHDDIEEFTTFSSSQADFDVNSKIRFQSPFLFNISKDMTLIEVATCLGSVKIFKHLMLTNAAIDLKKPFAKLAIQSGNNEIIRLIEQKGVSFEESAGVAMYQHNMEIFNWIVDTKQIKTPMLAMENCVKSNFINGLLFFLNNENNHLNNSNCTLNNSNDISKNSNNTSNYSIGVNNFGKMESCSKIIENASISGSYDILDILLMDNQKVYKLNNALVSSVEYGEIRSVEILVKYFNIDINKPNRRFLTPLHLASLKGDVFMLDFLIKSFKDININIQERYGASSLHLTIRGTKLEAFKFLLKQENIDVNLADYGGTTPVHEAICSGNFEFLEILLKDQRTLINIADQMGLTPLNHAIANKNCEAVKLLLNSQKPLEKQQNNKNNEENDNVNNDTNNDKKVNYLNESLIIALDHALYEIANVILKDDRININDSSLLVYLVKNKLDKVLLAFIKNPKFKINQKFGEEEKALLHFCSIVNNFNYLIPIILDRSDVDINVKDSDGVTPLHEAMKSQNNKYSILLVKHPKVDINARDNNNQTPLHYASSNWSSTPITDLLLHPKIDVNLVDKDGKTALFVACELGLADNVEILLNCDNIDTEIEIESVHVFI